MEKLILVIEDEPGVRDPLVDMLQAEFPDYFFEGVESAEAARSILQNEREGDRVIQLVIVDEVLGEGKERGSEFLAYLRQNYPGIRRIMFESKAGPEDITRAVNRGSIDKYIHKRHFDIDHGLLFNAIREALSQREGELHDAVLEVLQEAEADDATIIMAGEEELKAHDLMKDISQQTSRGREYMDRIKKLFCSFFLNPRDFMAEIERLGKEHDGREKDEK